MCVIPQQGVKETHGPWTEGRFPMGGGIQQGRSLGAL